ncbi:hypothetical protein H6F86_16080 [Phormidium sp. FACHB-592]|uniref:DUF4231 domain-containing protein n=1 Tax=Stenomitos frigidus AS-A4 TaxID=2933935 RepID=A0ABV0KL32_9CYAN|nr:hypothetical protein [Phormidium sp. FACHB-592]MBD2075387.1 hypothetical protein [Phormidium sp. FACHB-592]
MQTEVNSAAAVDAKSSQTAPLPQRGQFISPKNHQPTLLGHIVISTSLVLGICLSYALMFWFAGTKQNEWLSVTSSLEEKAVNTAIANLPTKPAEKARLIDQFDQIQDRIQKHGSVMGFFYKQYYISLSMICGGSVIASICLFFISKSGWERVNNALINIFIVSSSTVILYGNISLVFKQEENIKDNQALYLSYFALRNEMLSYWATQQVSTGDTIVPAAKFIHYMDGRLQELSQIRLGFDATGITDLGDQMKQLDGSSQKQAQPNVKK